MRITQYILIHSLNQLHDAGFTINDYVSGSHLINFRIQKFQLGALSLLLKCPKGYTIAACLSPFPEVIASARTHIKLLRLTFSKQLKLFQPYKRVRPKIPFEKTAAFPPLPALWSYNNHPLKVFSPGVCYLYFKRIICCIVKQKTSIHHCSSVVYGSKFI